MRRIPPRNPAEGSGSSSSPLVKSPHNECAGNGGPQTSHAEAAAAGGEGGKAPCVCLIRAPIMPLLVVEKGPSILFRPFKSPLKGHQPGVSEESLRKTLGVRLKRSSAFAIAAKQFKSPPPASSVPPSPSNPLILYTPPPDKPHEHKVEVDPALTRWLREHQRQGVKFLFDCLMGLKEFQGEGCILADDMGLGKTLQSITVLWTLLEQGIDGKPAVRRAVVVCPASLVNNWASEIHKWLEGRCGCTAVADSCKEKVVSKFEGFRYDRQSRVLISSYETFRMHASRLEGVPIDLVVCDEAHRLKNDRTKTALAISELPARKRLLLSGTPIQNDLDEFFALVSLCNPSVVGDVHNFRRRYANPIMAGREPDASEEQQQLAAERLTELSSLTNLFILRRTNSLLAAVLPPKIVLEHAHLLFARKQTHKLFLLAHAWNLKDDWSVNTQKYLKEKHIYVRSKVDQRQNVFCRLTTVQKEFYNIFLASKSCKKILSDEAQGGGGFTGRVLSSIQGLMKLCNHPSLIKSQCSLLQGFEKCEKFFEELDLEGSKARCRSVRPEVSGKLFLLSRLLDVIRTTTRDKVVLISNYTQTLDLFDRLCRDSGYPVVRLDGQTSIKRRHAMITKFNDPTNNESFVFLLSSKAGGCGVNLIGANRLVLFDPDWNPANDKQALARVWRDGQKKTCYIYRFFSTGTIEEKIYQRQICKDGLSAMLVSEGENQIKDSLSTELVKDLFRLREDTVSDTHDMLDCQRCLASSAIGSRLRPPQARGEIFRAAEAEEGKQVVTDGSCQDTQQASVPQLELDFDEDDLLTWAHHWDVDSLPDVCLQQAARACAAADAAATDNPSTFSSSRSEQPISFAMSCRIEYTRGAENQIADGKREKESSAGDKAGGAALSRAPTACTTTTGEMKESDSSDTHEEDEDFVLCVDDESSFDEDS